MNFRDLPTEPAEEQIQDEVQASHLLVKHKGSRRASSWKEENITRTKEEARSILQEFRDQIDSGKFEKMHLTKKCIT